MTQTTEPLRRLCQSILKANDSNDSVAATTDELLSRVAKTALNAFNTSTTYHVSAGESVQAAITAACGLKDADANIIEISCPFGYEVPDGTLISVTVSGHATEADYNIVFEFTESTDIEAAAGHTRVSLEYSKADWADALTASAAALTWDANIGWDTISRFMPSGGYTKISATCTGSFVSSVKGHYRSADADDFVFMLAPGTYTGRMSMPSRTHLVGVNRDTCILTRDVGDTDSYVDFLLINGSNCSISNLTVDDDYVAGSAEDATSQWRSIIRALPADRTTRIKNISVTNCTLLGMSWGTYVTNCDNLLVSDCYVAASNPFWLESTIDGVIQNNSGYWHGAQQLCLAMADLTSKENYNITVANNSFVLHGLSTSCTPYIINIGGCAHNVVNNLVSVITNVGAAPSVSYMIQLFSSVVPSGRLAKDNIIANNTCSITHTIGAPSSLRVILADTTSTTNACVSNLIMSKNLITNNATTSVELMKCRGDDFGTPNIFIDNDGINGIDGTVELLNFTVTGLPRGSGAGLTSALLDTAFCAGVSANRKKLANWFRGKYTNTADSNKVYTVWTDGTAWHHALQTVLA